MTSPLSDNPPNGWIGPHTATGEWNRLQFQIAQQVAKLQTSTVVEVLSCTNSGSTDPVGFVNVRVMVNQIDAAGNPIPHVTIYNVPYVRIQGGADAVIIDPKPGDIGIAVFASRDISKIKSTKAGGNPGSNRQYSFSDAMYIGGLLNGTPTQYVRFSDDGVEMVSPAKTQMVVGANSAMLDTSQFLVTVAGKTLRLDASGLWHNDVNIGDTHEHTGVTPGLANTGPPAT